MKTMLLIATGVLILAGSFAVWYGLNALACGMNTTGCKQVRLNWGDWEALRIFAPTFLLGLGLLLAGGWRLVRHARSKAGSPRSGKSTEKT